ncbi:MAG: hypothetical protein LUD15_09350 [Bacteroides sp.]|nr:hypothetical protein [Bacteroides sp.]
MRNSISFLPTRQQNDLIYAVRLICERLPQAKMIFLYGDLADENYLIPDGETEDFQLLVVTQELTYKEVGKILDKVEYDYKKSSGTHNEILIVSEDIDKFNEILSQEGDYFIPALSAKGYYSTIAANAGW